MSFRFCIPNLHIKHSQPNTHNLAFIISDYKGIMDIIMKTLCKLGIPNQHNIHNLKNRQNCSTSAVPQVNVHNLPNAHKVPNQRIIRTASTEQAMPNPTSTRVC